MTVNADRLRFFLVAARLARLRIISKIGTGIIMDGVDHFVSYTRSRNVINRITILISVRYPVIRIVFDDRVASDTWRR